MKKTLIVLAMTAALVLAFAAPAMAVGPFYTAASQNASAAPAAYLSWDWAKTNAGETGTPHGNYGTTTNKCAVCHSVHGAEVGGVALTAIPEAGYADYTDACAFCHANGSTFTDAVVMADVNGNIAPHTDCNRCHIESPHGAGASTYPVLTARLINDNVDTAIAADLVTNGAVLTAEGVDYDDAGNQQALTIGTGLLCESCHAHGHAVYAAAGDDYQTPESDHGTLTGSLTHATGHRVLAEATTDWNADGYVLDPATSPYGAYFSNAQVAWNPTGKCSSCHDQKLADGVTQAFPHGYVNADGDYVGKTTDDTAGLIWLTTAADADDDRTLLPRGATATNNERLTRDGLCIKCHVSGDGTAGVGISF